MPAAASLIDRIYAINQYIQVDEQTEQLLEWIAQSCQKLMGSRDIEATLQSFHFGLEGMHEQKDHLQ